MRSKNYVKKHNDMLDKALEQNSELHNKLKKRREYLNKIVKCEDTFDKSHKRNCDYKKGKVIGVTREFIVVKFKHYTECFSLIDIANQLVGVKVVA